MGNCLLQDSTGQTSLSVYRHKSTAGGKEVGKVLADGALPPGTHNILSLAKGIPPEPKRVSTETKVGWVASQGEGF